MPVMPPSHVRSRRFGPALRTLLASLALVVAGCDSGPFAPSMRPRETFNWTDQPVSLTPPPAGWRREGQSSGGVRGAWFVKERSVGEGIGVGDYYLLSQRLRRAKLQAILDQFDSLDQDDFQDAVRLAYAYTDSPFTELEAEVAEEINGALGRAAAARRTGDRDEARAQLSEAPAAAERLRFTLEDVIQRVEFSPERKQDPKRWHLLGRREARIGGKPAVIVDYTYEGDERKLYGREMYVMHDDHLYIANFIGLKGSLAVFDRLVESIQFPS